MWSLWHGSKLEQYASRQKAEKQPLLASPQGSERNTQHCADLMWRAGSPEGYQPPAFANHEGYSADDVSAAWPKPQQSSFAALQNLPSNRQHRSKSTGALQPCLHQAYSQDSEHSTRPGTPPTTSAVHQASRYSTRGYQPLLDPLLPVSDLQPLTSSTQPSAHRDVHRTSSFSAGDRAYSHTSMHPQHTQHDTLMGFSEQPLPGLDVPLGPHEQQLLNNLLHRSHSARSQDRSSDHSHSSTSTHHDGQLPLSCLHSLPRSFSDRRLSTNSVLRCDKGMLHEPSELSRHMKRIGSGQLMVTEGDKVVTPSQLGLIGAAPAAGSPARHQQLFLHSIQEDGSSQVAPCLTFSSLDPPGQAKVHAVPIQSTRHVVKQQEEGLRMWKEQLKWVLLWLTLSLLTCMHSAALILALQYNLIAMAFGGMFCLSGLLGMYGSCVTLAGFCMSRHFAISGISIFKIKQIEVLAFTTMVISALAAIIHFTSVNIIHNVGTGNVPGGHICNPGDAACEQNYNFVIIMMVSTTVLYGCHALVSAALAFKAHGVRRAVRQLSEPLLL